MVELGFWRVYLALPGCAEVKEDNVARVSAASLSRCVDTCRTKNKDDAKYLACVTVCENDFLLARGSANARSRPRGVTDGRHQAGLSRR